MLGHHFFTFFTGPETLFDIHSNSQVFQLITQIHQSVHNATIIDLLQSHIMFSIHKTFLISRGFVCQIIFQLVVSHKNNFHQNE